MAKQTELQIYIAKVNAAVEAGTISQDAASTIIDFARDAAGKGGNFGAGDRADLNSNFRWATQYTAAQGQVDPVDPVDPPVTDPDDGVTRPTAPGAAWQWNGTSWFKPDAPTTGGPWIWDDNTGWVIDVAKVRSRTSARETLQSWFEYYGIDDASATGGVKLSQLIYDWVEQDKSMDWIRLELRKSEQYKARFPGMEALSKKGMAISEAEYISNERSYMQVLKASGMPKGFYDDRQDFANFMVAEVSPQELASRVQIAKDYVQMYAPQSVKDQLRGLYGFSDEQMAAYVLDTSPDKMKSLAAIESEYATRVSQARVGGAAVDQGFALSTSLRDQIASMGYDYNQASSGLYRTRMEADPYRRLGDLYGMQTSTEELVQETFGLGGGAETTTKKKKLASKERAAFGGSTALSASSLAASRIGQV